MWPSTGIPFKWNIVTLSISNLSLNAGADYVHKPKLTAQK